MANDNRGPPPPNGPTNPNGLASLRTQRIQGLLVDWEHEDDDRISALLARHQALPHVNRASSGPGMDPPRSPTIRSISSTAYVRRSVISQAHTEPVHHTNLPRDAPSLTVGSTVDAESVFSIEGPEPYQGVGLFDPETGEFGSPHAVQPADLHLRCVFSFLDCPKKFSPTDEEVWRMHCTSHFRAHSPPLTAQCSFCDESFSYTDGFQCWSRKLDHLLESHLDLQNRRTGRPDFALYVYLWRKNIISTDLYQDLKGGSITGNFPRAHAALNDPHHRVR